jgi:ATP-dependent helicase/nuclease subunit A
VSASNFNPALLERVSERQRRGADAHANAWVSASAGAGKTRVLRDRVLRLLMAGVAPGRILCLTFTKAAAAEMSRRINNELGEWTVAEDAALMSRLTALFGAPPDPDALVRARRLFARVLDAPGGMKIMTIHAFCQSVLRRFPLEAGVAPHFRVMEDRDTAELLKAAQADVLMAAEHPESGLAEAMMEVAGRIHEARFPDLLAEITRARTRFAALFDQPGGFDAVIDRLAVFLGVARGTHEADILAAACHEATFDGAALDAAVEGLQEGSKIDGDRAKVIAAWVRADFAIRAELFESYCEAFLTRTGELRKTLATKKALSAAPETEDTLVTEGLRLIEVRERMRKAALLAANEAIARIAQALLARYAARKSAMGRLDFDDLVARTRALLQKENAPPWVLFKLDGGIDHVLIDEGQDSNLEQWDVVIALVEEFYLGMSARDEEAETLGLPERSVFAVGDIKQSIYSFQGADPRRFIEMRDYLQARAEAAGRTWKNVRLDFSFRSSAPVLQAVDKVFEPEAARAGVIDPEESNAQHTPLRDRDAGRVELWPPLIVEGPDNPEPWKPPVDPVSVPDAMDRLAETIAAQIADWLDSNELLESAGRPIRADDIMVLVRQRGAFVESLVRALKTRNVHVAGVDRMVLTDQIAVMDLLALGDFLLLPEDDLTLASLLKSPLIGLDEEQLFALAHGREKTSLWHTLRARQGENPAFATAAEFLSELLSRVDYERPYELFAGVLARGGRERMLARLGPDVADPIDEFLSLALTFERSHPPVMQGFLQWVAAGRSEVKRDLDQTGGAVRVMTVHGAKGLEAPIVFLPDTTRLPRHLPNILWYEDGELPFFVWLPRVEDGDTATLGLREAVRARRDEEYRRLLYVAMTRAEERLYVCGWDAPQETSWYAMVAAAMDAIARSEENAFLADRGYEDAHTMVLDAGQRAPVLVTVPGTAPEMPPPPAWIAQPPPVEPHPSRPLAPSDPGTLPPVRTPIDRAGDERLFVRGNVLHRLLQWLPELDPMLRRAAAERYVARPVLLLDKDARANVVDEVMAVLESPDFAHLFASGSLAEVAVTGRAVRGDGALQGIAGQIDRLVAGPDAISIVDYKSNRPPPNMPEEVAPVYLRQLAAYRHIVRDAWPGLPVRAYLLWTDGPRLMAIPDNLLDAHDPAENMRV